MHAIGQMEVAAILSRTRHVANDVPPFVRPGNRPDGLEKKVENLSFLTGGKQKSLAQIARVTKSFTSDVRN
jgi:hypothetical protein